MINLAKMKMMKKTSIIINISRGGVVNEKDLNKALNDRENLKAWSFSVVPINLYQAHSHA